MDVRKLIEDYPNVPIKSQVGKESVLLYSAVVVITESSNCSE